jgi:hypothetical protein
MAESLLYTKFETPILFQASAGDVTLNLASLAANTGIYSNQLDRGAGSIATRYVCAVTMQKSVASIVNEVIGVYFFSGNGTTIDGNLSTTGTTLTTVMLPNAFVSFGVVVESTSTTVPFIRSAVIEVPTRYLTIGVMNSLTGALATGNTCNIRLTPLVDALQAAA